LSLLLRLELGDYEKWFQDIRFLGAGTQPARVGFQAEAASSSRLLVQ
jgi:hypothetical protein